MASHSTSGQLSRNGKGLTNAKHQLDSCQVIRHSEPTPTNPLHALQIGSSDKPEKTTTAQLLGHFRKAGTNPKYELQEFSVTPDAVLGVGTELNAGHFVPGQYVDVTATS